MAAEAILIVDDDKAFTQAAMHFLADCGYVVHPALTGRSGYLKSLEHRPDLVIVDVNLPDLDGVEVARLIQEAQPSTPLIMISSDDSRETVDRCLAVAPQSFLSKPLIPDKLITAIAGALDNGRTLR